MTAPDCTCAAKDHSGVEHSKRCAYGQWMQRLLSDVDESYSPAEAAAKARAEQEGDSNSRESYLRALDESDLTMTYAEKAELAQFDHVRDSNSDVPDIADVLAADDKSYWRIAGSDVHLTEDQALAAATAGEVVEWMMGEDDDEAPAAVMGSESGRKERDAALKLLMPSGNPDEWADADWEELDHELGTLPIGDAIRLEELIWDTLAEHKAEKPGWFFLPSTSQAGSMDEDRSDTELSIMSPAGSVSPSAATPVQGQFTVPCIEKCDPPFHGNVHLYECPNHPRFKEGVGFQGGARVQTALEDGTIVINGVECTCSAHKYPKQDFRHIANCPLTKWNPGFSSTASTTKYVPSCKHDRGKNSLFKLTEDLSISLVSHRDVKYTSDEDVDLGVYLYDSWGRNHMMVSAGLDVPWEDPLHTKAVMLDWPDFGVYKDLPQLVVVINWTLDQIAQGKRVETACMGGHGRTGTMACCMLIAADATVTPGEALERVRKDHCNKAVENDKQADMVAAFYKLFHSNELWRKSKTQRSLFNKQRKAGHKNYGSWSGGGKSGKNQNGTTKGSSTTPGSSGPIAPYGVQVWDPKTRAWVTRNTGSDKDGSTQPVAVVPVHGSSPKGGANT